MKESVTGCTHCGVCTENCEFLKKYDLTIGDTEKTFQDGISLFPLWKMFQSLSPGD